MPHPSIFSNTSFQENKEWKSGQNTSSLQYNYRYKIQSTTYTTVILECEIAVRIQCVNRCYNDKKFNVTNKNCILCTIEVYIRFEPKYIKNYVSTYSVIISTGFHTREVIPSVISNAQNATFLTLCIYTGMYIHLRLN